VANYHKNESIYFQDIYYFLYKQIQSLWYLTVYKLPFNCLVSTRLKHLIFLKCTLIKKMQ